MRTIMRLVLGVGLGLWLRDVVYRHGYRQSGAVPVAADDSLQSITGIGPVFETALHEIGIHNIAQLAQQNAETLASRLSVPVTTERIRRERWIEQAKERGA